MKESIESKKLIEQAFDLKDNFKIIYTQSKNNEAIVFFSSNGLYSSENFEETILQKDRYEWENISKNSLIQNKYKIIIFMRDLKYNFYKSGINKKLNTQEKVIEKIKEIIKDYDLTTCGSSAGGYMAEMAGIKLNAKRIFSVGAIKNEELKNLIKPENVLFFFASYNNKIDRIQYELIKENAGVYCFLLNSNAHAIPLEGKCYPYLLSMENEKIINLSNNFKNKIIGKRQFFNSIVPFRIKFLEYLKTIFYIKKEISIKEYIIIYLLGIKIKFTIKKF